jgi:hypothetical protein
MNNPFYRMETIDNQYVLFKLLLAYFYLFICSSIKTAADAHICCPPDYRQHHYTLRLFFVRYFVETFKDVRSGRSKSSYRLAPWHGSIFLSRPFLLVMV